MYNYSETNRVRWIKLKRASEPVEDWINVDQIQEILSQDDPGEIRIILAGNTVGGIYKYDFDKVPELLIKIFD
ncbi:hypothetical protein LBSP_21370 [Lentilactobacillus buchneri subsp. silagei]|uniref:hypothetical protein n=1 Tax=Lentilactobacillus buchneri TaxID=1581 RepID=UPI0012E65DB4|nr:hypothetical protein [Lentilactobacillus buchneri]GED95577.1 hypothetical protein LBSP_21370 [Lentilactobacillus buchneri subsp. silagei]